MKHIFDGHCDVLYKLWQKNQPGLFFTSTDQLHSSFMRLKKGNVGVQTMAIFVPPDVPHPQKYYAAMQMIDILYEEILAKDPTIHLMTDSEQLKQIQPYENHHLYILLSLEGADPLCGDLTSLRTFYRLGVRSVGLTWNFRNEAADGVQEIRPGGLSVFGLDLLAEMNRLKMAVDVSHLSEKGFWDCIEYSTQPVMASHSNARSLCNHPRNLSDEQIIAIIQSGGLIGVNFVPYFLSDADASLEHVFNHIDHMLALGAENHIGIGSDFDGITATVAGLEHSGKMSHFIQRCQKYYSEKIVRKLLFDNWRSYYLTLWDN